MDLKHKDKTTPASAPVIEGVDMTQNKTSAATRMQIRFGDRGVGFLAGLVLVVSVIVVGLLDYLLAFFLAVQAVPNLMAAVQQGTGVTMDMPINVIIAGWIVPSLFLVAVMFAAALLAMRWLWRRAMTLHRKVKSALLPDTVGATTGSVKPRTTATTK